MPSKRFCCQGLLVLIFMSSFVQVYYGLIFCMGLLMLSVLMMFVSVVKAYLGVEMVLIVCFLLILSFSLLPLAFFMLSANSDYSREKLSPYECGFEPVFSARTSFSVRFFLVAVLFVVFDVELSILVAIIFSVSFMKNLVSLVSVVVFLLVLFFGLFHEFREGSLNWIS